MIHISSDDEKKQGKFIALLEGIGIYQAMEEWSHSDNDDVQA